MVVRMPALPDVRVTASVAVPELPVANAATVSRRVPSASPALVTLTVVVSGRTFGCPIAS